MQNKRIVVIFIIMVFVVTFGVVYFFVVKKKMSPQIENKKVVYQPTDEQRGDYAKIQNQFVFDFPCGINEFDSPYAKSMECEEGKGEKGEDIKVELIGKIVDEKGSLLRDVHIVANGREFTSNNKGEFKSTIIVDSNKKAIVLAADKFGYSPIRKVLNAQMPNEDWSKFEVPNEFLFDFSMREIEAKNINLDSSNEITITSEKYPGLSVTIPANSLENSKGESVSGDITGEITFLDPKNPADVALVPGLEVNGKQMVGIDHNGRQVTLDSKGMVFFHLKQKGSNELLQPKKGVKIIVRQPIPDNEYELMTKPEAVAAGQLTDAEYKAQMDEFKKMGITDDMSEDEKYEILVKNDRIGVCYWYFNQKTGIWEEWPISGFDVDIENKVYVLKVAKLY